MVISGYLTPVTSEEAGVSRFPLGESSRIDGGRAGFLQHVKHPRVDGVALSGFRGSEVCAVRGEQAECLHHEGHHLVVWTDGD